MTSHDLIPHNPVPCKKTMRIAVSHQCLYKLPAYNAATHTHSFTIDQIIDFKEKTMTFHPGWKKILTAKIKCCILNIGIDQGLATKAMIHVCELLSDNLQDVTFKTSSKHSTELCAQELKQLFTTVQGSNIVYAILNHSAYLAMAYCYP